LLVAADGQGLRGYELPTGEAVWVHQADQQPEAPVTSLEVHDEMVIATTPRSFEVRRAASGEALGAYIAGESSRLVAAAIVGDCCYGLFRKAASERARGREQWLVLTRVALPPPYRESPATRADPRPIRFSLGRAEPVRQALWIGPRLVLVEQNHLRAYTLP
jgi:hypothetical protein